MLNIPQTLEASKKEFRFSRYFKTETEYSQWRLKTGDNKTQPCPSYANTRSSNWPDQVIATCFPTDMYPVLVTPRYVHPQL
jgi:hypothetical protein